MMDAKTAAKVERVIEQMNHDHISLETLIDGHIAGEGIVGVGLITLRNELNSMVNKHL